MVRKNESRDLSSLKEHWNDTNLSGVDYQRDLKRRLLKDPTFLYKSNAENIAGLLSRFEKSFPDRELIAEIYRHTNLHNYHSYQAAELTQRLAFLRRLDTDPVQIQAHKNWDNPFFSDEDKLSALRELHAIQAEIYGFEEDNIHAVIRRTRYLNGRPCISNGSHDLLENAIYINIYQPENHAPLTPSFRRSYADAAVTIGHEGVHTKQTFFGRHPELIDDAETRNVARIMEINAFGAYYLNNHFQEYLLNPCEQEAFDFQNDLKAFLEASAEGRLELLEKIKARRDAHLNHQPLEQVQRYSPAQPILAVAA